MLFLVCATDDLLSFIDAYGMLLFSLSSQHYNFLGLLIYALYFSCEPQATMTPKKHLPGYEFGLTGIIVQPHGQLAGRSF
jgi:hypothetical protein